jgi:prepilin-type N-terminal cleavage/methylation domain-containing protein
MRAERRGGAGFSLLEVVVALAILGLALAGFAESLRGGIASGASATTVQGALALAEARLAALGTSEKLAPGTASGEFGRYRWRTQVEEAPDEAVAAADPSLPPLYSLKVSVSWERLGRRRSIALETRRLGPPAETR